MPLSRFNKVAAAADIHPWSWIAVIYGLQLVTSIAAVPLFKLPFMGMVLPLAILLIGALVALIFRYIEGRSGTASWKWLLPALIYGGFIFSLSRRSFPGASIPVDTSFFHPFEFMTLGIFLCCLALPILKKRGKLAFMAFVLSVGGIYGVIDEVHQAWVPGRKSDPLDVILDVVGLGMGLVVFFGSLRLKQYVSELRKNSTDQ